MNKEEYLAIRNTPQADTAPVLHFFFTLKSGRYIDQNQFNYFFGLWLQFFGIHNLGEIHYKVFVELDKYFGVEYKPDNI